VAGRLLVVSLPFFFFIGIKRRRKWDNVNSVYMEASDSGCLTMLLSRATNPAATEGMREIGDTDIFIFSPNPFLHGGCFNSKLHAKQRIPRFKPQRQNRSWSRCPCSRSSSHSNPSHPLQTLEISKAAERNSSGCPTTNKPIVGTPAAVQAAAIPTTTSEECEDGMRYELR
jgi:hypothetical protein